METRMFMSELRLVILTALGWLFAAFGQGAESTRNLLQAENIFYTEVKLVKKYYGFNEVINTTTPSDGGFIKKYRRLEWSGSVKESGTQAYQGTQRTDFTGSASFAGPTLTNNLVRSVYRNLYDPANEGDGSGGPYVVQGYAGGGCGPLNTANLLNETVGTPGSNVAVATQVTIVNPMRRETLGHMNLLWSSILFPCNAFTFQTPSDTFQSMGPIVEQLSEPSDAVVITDTRTTGYRVTPTASLIYRMEDNSPWTPLSPTPGLLEDTAYECVLQFHPSDGGNCAGKTFTAVLNIETWEGTGPHTFETRRYAVNPDPSRSSLGEIETTVTLRAEKIGQSLKIVSAALEMDGPNCSTGCATEPGGTAGGLGSVNWSMDLGLLPGGKSAGLLSVKRDVWSAALYTPAMLAYAPPGQGNAAGATVLRADNTLRQIRTGVYLVDIITPVEDTGLETNSYEIRFYRQAGSTPSVTNPKLFVPAGSALYVTRFSDPDGLGTRLAINRFAAGQSEPVRSIEYAYTAATNTWSFTEAGLRRTDKSITTLSAAEEQELTTIWDIAPGGGLTKVSEVRDKYRRYVLGGLTHRVLHERVLDPAGVALMTTWNYSVNSLGMLRLLEVNRHDGSWEKIIYQNLAGPNGEVTRIYNSYTPFINSGPTSSFTQQRRRAEAEVPDVDFDGDGRRDAHGEVYELIGSILSGIRSIRFTKLVTFDGQPCYADEKAQLIAPSFSPTNPALRWERRYTYAAGPFAGRVAYVRRPDLTLETTTYSFDAATGRTTEVRSSGAPDAAQTSVVDGTRTTTVTDADGRLVTSTTVDIASGLTVDTRAVLDRDAYGRPTVVSLVDGTLEESSYFPCCGLLASVKRHGLITTFTYDGLGRKETETSRGITTIYTYDALDRIVKTVRRGSDNSEIVTNRTGYDIAGRMISLTDAVGRVTGFAEVYNADRTITRTTTFPDTSTSIEVSNADGSPASRTGTRSAPFYREYSVGAASGITCIVTTDYKGEPGTSSAEWVRSYDDALGRHLKTEFPDGASTFSEYDAVNRLATQYDPDGIATRFSYNARGEQETTAVDMNNNGVIDFAGTDRVTQVVNTVALHGSIPVRRTATLVWETDGQNSPTTHAIAEVSVDGLNTWQTVRGQITSSTMSYGPTGDRTVTTISPDGVKTIQVYANDLLVSTTVKTAAEAPVGAATYGYDTHNRQVSVTDARNGTTTFAYFADDQLQSTTTPDPDLGRSGPGYDPQVTTYHYDNAGRPDTVTHPDGSVVNTTYWPTGAVKRTWGSRTYPVEYTYDPQGRVKTLKTWQDFASEAGAAVTTWNYHAQRGWLESKRYTDNTGPSYTYKPSGRLLTRVWARTPVITTTYGYNAAGDLNGINYTGDNDVTPDVSMTYDRLGRPKTMTDGSGSRTLTYDMSGQLKDEDYTAGLLATLGVHRTFDSLHRLATTSAHSASSVVNQVGYSYDAASRLDTVTAGANTATYGYATNSPLVQSVTFKQAGTARLTTTKVHDYLNRLASVTSAPSASPVLSFSYDYNSANQRTKTTREDNARWDYAYDVLGQVTAAKKYLSSGTAMLGHDFAYTFDDIGNRKTATANSQLSTYTPTLLNTYSQRTVPGSIDVMGAAQADATVTVMYPAVNGNIFPTTRQGDLYFKQLSIDNSAAAQYASVKVTGVKNLSGPNGEDAVTEETRSVLVSGTPEAFTHDADGNLTADAKWSYTWDAENRLVAVETAPATSAAGAAKQKIEFAYDGQSRRFSKKVYSWNGSAWQLASHTLTLYDGWNMIAELNALSSNALTRSYAWGTDLSGSLQGAGGVGGLLFSNLHLPAASSHAPAFDGNGNVIGYVDMATGIKVAEYEYGAFGETLIADGVAAEAMPFKFSTKYTDAETGLIDYSQRFYDPNRGRFLSRDPIEEDGGANVYGFVANDSISNVDVLGLAGFFFDGTGNNEKSGTNVRILWQVDDDVNKKYYRGVGSSFGTRAVGGLTGTGGHNRLEAAYRDFISFIDAGDRYVDIVGFSRGAALAREFANLLNERGYDPSYGGNLKHKLRAGTTKPPGECEFVIRFVGLFDTVGSFGVPGNDINIGIRMDLPGSVGNAAQATAQNERRLLFPLTPLGDREGFDEQSFPGDHSDIGRGHGKKTNDLSRAPLEYIWNQGRAAGVPFGALPDYTPTGNTTPHDLSRKFPHNLFPKRPR